MSDKPASRIGTSISILGWIVAVCSLILNYANYRDAQTAKVAAEKQNPVYTTNVSTYDPANLPADILKIAQPIRHEFSIKHQSGKSVIDLVATFTTKDKEIISIDLTEASRAVQPQSLQQSMKLV